jgi:hypothetical protein
MTIDFPIIAKKNGFRKCESDRHFESDVLHAGKG